MALIFAIVLGMLALAFVLYPLYRLPVKRKQADVVEAESTVAATELVEREHSARSAIQEVELDYQLGNIEETDYRSLRERYMRRALTALKSRYEREQEIDTEIEEQLQKLKESYAKTDQE
ncbi:hypothetical protein KDW_14150 [Dictyobacter vulcani]|uniref:C-type cytochrome biogenesis protein CcmI n=1 Tax=Dictyobacter vulcani TaxID=2607529 RepID=A0A5J4KHP0_9CHLR|nr:hypothetical protein [Dictyobacter vulcani]GER87253.1 hypothetical protein KDW_14150 [Dictyobacter vulcani]